MIFVPGITFSLSQWEPAQHRSKMSTPDLSREENFKSFKSSTSPIVKVREEAEKKEFLIFKAEAREQDSESSRQCPCDGSNYTGSGWGGGDFLHVACTVLWFTFVTKTVQVTHPCFCCC